MSVSESVGRAPGRVAKGSRVVVVGGGISGLAAAFRLTELAQDVELTILEASDRIGGVLQTERADGYLIEASADSFITTFPWGVDLCKRLGLEGDLLETTPDKRRAFVVHDGRLQPIPDGLLVMAPTRVGPILRTPILSPLGKLRMACEWFVPRGEGGDESLAAFATRRFGREAFERLIQPLVSGMYTGDPQRLSVRATLPRFLDLESKHGSLIRGLRKEAGANGSPGSSGSGARYGMFVGLRDGMASLVDALAARLPAGSIRRQAAVEHLERIDGRWIVAVRGEEPIEAGAVVIATPVGAAARLLGEVAPEAAALAAQVPTARSAVASLVYRRDQIADPLDGFGFVVPIRERLRILSASYASVKFPGRCPDGQVLIRVFLGGATRPEMLDQDDAALVGVAHEELSRLLGIEGSPILNRLHRWNEVMPQYHVGHLDRVDAVERAVAAVPGLAVAGNALRGIGVPQCIRQGELAAERIAASVLAS